MRPPLDLSELSHVDRSIIMTVNAMGYPYIAVAHSMCPIDLDAMRELLPAWQCLHGMIIECYFNHVFLNVPGDVPSIDGFIALSGVSRVEGTVILTTWGP